MKILHYNDEERELHHYLTERGHTNIVLAAEQDPFEAVDREHFDAAFVGLHPHGLQLIRRLHRVNRDCLVTIVTADPKPRPAVEAMKLGAFDYLLTPLDFAEVERNVLIMSRQYEGQQERHGLELRLAEATRGSGGKLAGRSLREIVAFVERRAIEESLAECRGNVARAARMLSISRTTLYSKLDRRRMSESRFSQAEASDLSPRG